LTKRLISKNIIKDLVIVALGVIIIWIGLQLAFGTENPFYVVASGSMIPKLMVYDVLIVQGHVLFEDVQIGDIIVFDRPTGHDRVIVHRVVAITNEDPKIIRTKGDNNNASIPGTDFPITKEEYIGKVEYIIPKIGFVTQVLKPPTNYILIVLVISVMVVKEIIKRKNVKEISETFNSNDSDKLKDYSNLDKLEKDSAYSEHSDSKISDDKSEVKEEKKNDETKN
jgi:signal peptidase